MLNASFIFLCPVFSGRPFINEKLKSSTTNFGNTIPRIVEDAIEESSKKSKFGLTLGFVTLGVILKKFWQSTSDFLQRCGFQIEAFKESFCYRFSFGRKTSAFSPRPDANASRKRSTNFCSPKKNFNFNFESGLFPAVLN